MSKDIASVLSDWPYEPGRISVRRIVGEDGQPKIQLRLDLGLLQMETEGRPDGQRPYGCESYLDYYRKHLRRHRLTHGSDEGFELDDEACEQIRTEAMMYYHRYLSEFALDEYEAVIRDTQRNLKALDLCNKYAVEETDRMAMEQFRPYILMMMARAKAMMSLERDDFSAARRAVEEGLEEIRVYTSRAGQKSAVEASGEMAVLQALLEEIERREPIDPVRAIEASLARAVEEERYEDAAQLRDQLRVYRGGVNHHNS